MRPRWCDRRIVFLVDGDVFDGEPHAIDPAARKPEQRIFPQRAPGLTGDAVLALGSVDVMHWLVSMIAGVQGRLVEGCRAL